MSEETAEPSKPVEKSKGKGKLIGIMVALALILGAGAAGAVLAPKYFGDNSAKSVATEGEEEADGSSEEHEDAGAKSGEGEGEAADAEHGSGKKGKPAAGDVHHVLNLDSLVVDARSADGNIRHVKVGLAIELTETTKEADFKLYIPRAREAAIAYFRTRDFEQLSDPKNFPQVVKDLNTEIIAAVGKKRAKRVVVSDFVAQ
jgi:flagellar basal body-associated protein FliL